MSDIHNKFFYINNNVLANKNKYQMGISEIGVFEDELKQYIISLDQNKTLQKYNGSEPLFTDGPLLIIRSDFYKK